jgi:xanthosine utilization system XapX-like protein
MSERSRAATHREAVDRIREARSLVVDLPVVGRVRIPRPEQVAYFGALGVLAAVEIIDWPIALAIAAGHVLVQNQHNRVAEEVGEALEDA